MHLKCLTHWPEQEVATIHVSLWLAMDGDVAYMLGVSGNQAVEYSKLPVCPCSRYHSQTENEACWRILPACYGLCSEIIWESWKLGWISLNKEFENNIGHLEEKGCELIPCGRQKTMMTNSSFARPWLRAVFIQSWISSERGYRCT